MTPLEQLEQFAERFQRLGDMLSDALNKILPGRGGKKAGFFLLVFHIGNPEKPCTFLADGASPRELIELLKETTRRLEKEQAPAPGSMMQ